jgi:nucleolar protein 6
VRINLLAEPKAGGNQKKERGKSKPLERDVAEQTQFEEKPTDTMIPDANTSGFRSSHTVSSAEKTSQDNVTRSRNRQSAKRDTTARLLSVGQRDRFSTRELTTGCSREKDTSDLTASDSDSDTEGGQVVGEFSGKKRRYIAFIGNLPFSITGDEIVEHFAKRGVKIMEARLLTKRGSGESRGCCFAEFPDTKSLQNALKFHHSLIGGRRLNIEVTCGGGGRGGKRMEKIKQRNERLRKVARKRVKSLRKGQEQTCLDSPQTIGLGLRSKLHQ